MGSIYLHLVCFLFKELRQTRHLVSVLPQAKDGRDLISEMLQQRAAKVVDQSYHPAALVLFRVGNHGIGIGLETLNAIVECIMLIDVGIHDALDPRHLLDGWEEHCFFAVVMTVEERVPAGYVPAEWLFVGGSDVWCLEVDRVKSPDHDIVHKSHL